MPPEKPLSSKQAPLCEWIKYKPNWLLYIDNYFETCRNTDFEEEKTELELEPEVELQFEL